MSHRVPARSATKRKTNFINKIHFISAVKTPACPLNTGAPQDRGDTNGWQSRAQHTGLFLCMKTNAQSDNFLHARSQATVTVAQFSTCGDFFGGSFVDYECSLNPRTNNKFEAVIARITASSQRLQLCHFQGSKRAFDKAGGSQVPLAYMKFKMYIHCTKYLSSST